MTNGVFVTGTDTNVGKTVLSAALLHRYRPVMPVRYWKPVQTGAPEDDDTALVRQLGACNDGEVYERGIRLPRPLSPHLSAKLCGRAIELETLRELAREAPADGYRVVEGAGGVLVPLNNQHFVIDLIAVLGLPALIAARSQLGTINHTLLTLEALRARAIAVAGVVLIGEPNGENRRAIETYGCVPVLGEMPRFAAITSEVLKTWAQTGLDPR